jgi:hypothetical protein
MQHLLPAAMTRMCSPHNVYSMKKGIKTMKNHLLAGLFIAIISAPAFAEPTDNTVTTNRLAFNALSMNALSMNRLAFNGATLEDEGRMLDTAASLADRAIAKKKT